LQLGLQQTHLVAHLQATLARQRLQALDLLLELADALLEIELTVRHLVPHAFTRRTWLPPKIARSSASRALSGRTCSERDRNRSGTVSESPLPWLIRCSARTSTAACPGWPRRAAAAESIAAASVVPLSAISTASVPFSRNCASGMTLSRKIGGSSSSRSRPLTWPRT